MQNKQKFSLTNLFRKSPKVEIVDKRWLMAEIFLLQHCGGKYTWISDTLREPVSIDYRSQEMATVHFGDFNIIGKEISQSINVMRELTGDMEKLNAQGFKWPNSRDFDEGKVGVK